MPNDPFAPDDETTTTPLEDMLVDSTEDAEGDGGKVDKMVALLLNPENGFGFTRNHSDDVVLMHTNRLGHMRTYQLDSAAFAKFARAVSVRWFRSVLKKDQISELSDTLSALISTDGSDPQDFHIRAAREKNYVYVDIGDDPWRVIQVAPTGWKILPYSECPVIFVRATHMQELPEPVLEKPTTAFRLFEKHMNTGTPYEARLMFLFAAFVLSGKKPFPILALIGGEGSFKSTMTVMLASLIDPSATPLKRPPKTARDFVAAAKNRYLLNYENVSRLSGELSDDMAAVATGASLGSRRLYTDADEAVFHAARPQIANGISAFITRPDLASRTLTVRPPFVSEGDRLPEAKVWADWEEDRPRILGGLLEMMSIALANMDTVDLSSLPRMADFGQFALACEPAMHQLWPAGTVAEDLKQNTESSRRAAMDANPVAGAIIALFSDPKTRRSAAERRTDDPEQKHAGAVRRPRLSTDEDGNIVWQGGADNLVSAVAPYVTTSVRADKDWPTDRTIREKLSRCEGLLDRAGIRVVFHSRRPDRSNIDDIVLMLDPSKSGGPT
ncbi:hypothetical protein [Ruegeria sp. HKCCA5491]|uniref:hypothetical protein n=1 Tax=Ruegeria sp. HKCCA5491 TaxID=2682986 RepID=UPI001489EA8E|nr:hypothetical protein [Ruegeria sp. HKCCA5491]